MTSLLRTKALTPSGHVQSPFVKHSTLKRKFKWRCSEAVCKLQSSTRLSRLFKIPSRFESNKVDGPPHLGTFPHSKSSLSTRSRICRGRIILLRCRLLKFLHQPLPSRFYVKGAKPKMTYYAALSTLRLGSKIQSSRIWKSHEEIHLTIYTVKKMVRILTSWVSHLLGFREIN